MNKENNINILELEREIRKVFELGYGDTIELKINGELYKIGGLEND